MEGAFTMAAWDEPKTIPRKLIWRTFYAPPSFFTADTDNVGSGKVIN
jgi:hypothetical protein